VKFIRKSLSLSFFFFSISHCILLQRKEDDSKESKLRVSDSKLGAGGSCL
jgi:hypothetical protein